ncbi:glycosyltransferase [Pseudomonas sp. KNUC1026]|uniref:glycosyltransferase n=1 Tax=Pseudomonas sp. KNUC1026 TaxID=2893890 RepID=UPI001F40E0D6|nr:glycosyltransferase [Pseudomonas sp. KNUC1026]UFH48116.1 hypothetical protein LN139_12940 [Pseudomonas sp. KNUC1026]
MPDGLSYSGLETVLQGLGMFPEAHHFPTDHSGFATSGFWDPQTYVNYKRSEYSPLLMGDLFNNLAQRQRARSLADADWEITTDTQVRKARWAAYLNDALNALGPLTLLLPEASLLLAAGGIAELGLGIDRLVHAHNLAEEAQSLGQASFGLLNATPLAEAALSAGAKVFTFKSGEFIWPENINGQWGYPLSPVDPPRLPPLRAHDFFCATDTLAPLAEADAGVSQAVVRITQPRGAPDELHSLIGNDVTRLRYDLEFNAFVSELDLNEINHPWYVSAGPGSHALAVQASEPVATDAQRLATLRALGNDLALPVDYPALLPSQATPIPRQVWGIWVGEHLIGDDLLDTIAANATTLEKIGYRNRLLLTRANPQRYQQNLEALALKAPGLEVLPLEEQPFYEAFRQGPMFEQYQAAIDGNGGVATNYASASDILRYPLLHSEGGIYKDLDDLWFDSPEFPKGQR